MNRYELLRYERGLSRVEVAESAGVPLNTLVRLEGGQTRRPSAHIAKALADFYEMSISEFLGIEDVAA